MTGERKDKPQSQTLRAVLELRNLVLSGEFAPGERLPEIALSDQLGVSRTPMRAAMLRLEQEGLLSPIPSGGYHVRLFSEEDVTDAIELRGVLEGTAVRLAAERGATPGRLRHLNALVAELDAVVAPGPEIMDFDAYVELNAHFHAALGALSGSRLIERELERATRLPFASPSAFLSSQAAVPAFRATLIVGQAQHRAIAEAIEMREGARGEALAREHARLARHNLAIVLGDKALAARVPAMKLVANRA